MHYNARAAAAGGVVLGRSSVRYFFFIVFLVLSAGFLAVARLEGLGKLELPLLDFLSSCALCIIFASASFIALMNKGSPNKIAIDGDGIILIHPGKDLRLWKEEIKGLRAVETISLPPDLDKHKRLSTKRIVIELVDGTAIPIYEGANEGKIGRIIARCSAALETCPSRRDLKGSGRRGGSLFEIKLEARGIVKKEGPAVAVRVPVKLDLPGFVMGSGMLAGFGIFLFGSLPGRIDRTYLVISIIIWGLIALSLAFALLFSLFGKQKLVIGEKEIALHRRFMGIPIPAEGLKRSEAASVLLDLESGKLSVISKELKRITREGPEGAPMGERMGELLGGKSVKLDLSALSWGERIAIRKSVAAALANP